MSVAADQILHVVGHGQARGRANHRVQQSAIVREPNCYDTRFVAGNDLFTVRRHFHGSDCRLMALSVHTHTNAIK